MRPLELALRVLANKSNYIDAQTVEMALEEMASLYAGLKSAVASLEQLAAIGRIPENMQGLRDGREALALAHLNGASGPEGRAEETPTAGQEKTK